MMRHDAPNGFDRACSIAVAVLLIAFLVLVAWVLAQVGAY